MGLSSDELVLAYAGLLLFIVPVALLFTMLVSLALISRFRRRVEHSMQTVIGGAEYIEVEPVPSDECQYALDIQWIEATREKARSFKVSGSFVKMRRQAWTTAAIYLVASGIYALTLTVGLIVAGGYADDKDSLLGFVLLFVFFYLVNATPLVLAPTLAFKKQLRFPILAIVLLIIALWSWTLFIPGLEPVELWLLYAGAPTISVLAFSTRRQRAVGPMVFAAMLIVVYSFAAGQVFGATYLLNIIGPIRFIREDLAQVPFLEAGQQFLNELRHMPIAERLAIVTALVEAPRNFFHVENEHALTTGLKLLMLLIGVATLVLGVIAALVLVWWFARRYEHRQSSDQMVTIDVLMVVFTIWMFLVFGSAWGWRSGIWVLVAFASYILFTRWYFHQARHLVTPKTPVRLLFLRVFGFSNRTQRLLEDLGQYWRYGGPIRLIAGVDVTYTNIEPHEFLEFLNGRLARSFVRDYGDLKQRTELSITKPDPDGLFRVEDFFCHADSWRMAISHLVLEADAVLMDLRGFGPRQRGCVFEIEQLIATVPVSRILLLADDSTDAQLLRATLDQAWQRMPISSPNRTVGGQVLRVLRASSNHRRTLENLIGSLSNSARAL